MPPQSYNHTHIFLLNHYVVSFILLILFLIFHCYSYVQHRFDVGDVHSNLQKHFILTSATLRRFPPKHPSRSVLSADCPPWSSRHNRIYSLISLLNFGASALVQIVVWLSRPYLPLCYSYNYVCLVIWNKSSDQCLWHYPLMRHHTFLSILRTHLTCNKKWNSCKNTWLTH